MGHWSWTHELKALRTGRVNGKRRSVVHGARQRLILVLTSWRHRGSGLTSSMPRLHCCFGHRSVLHVHGSELKVPSSKPYDFLQFLQVSMFGKNQFMAVRIPGQFPCSPSQVIFLTCIQHLQCRCLCMSRPGFTATVKCCCCIHLFRAGCGPSSLPACFRFQCAMANTRMSK